MISKDLQYSTGNSTQYSVTACIRKESKKRVDICICIMIHFAEHLKLKQHCKSTILQ